jgi:hypothetical protein
VLRRSFEHAAATPRRVVGGSVNSGGIRPAPSSDRHLRVVAVLAIQAKATAMATTLLTSFRDLGFGTMQKASSANM